MERDSTPQRSSVEPRTDHNVSGILLASEKYSSGTNLGPLHKARPSKVRKSSC